jgi:hypothetical protein
VLFQDVEDGSKERFLGLADLGPALNALDGYGVRGDPGLLLAVSHHAAVSLLGVGGNDLLADDLVKALDPLPVGLP